MDWGEFDKNIIGKKMIVLLAVTGAVYFFLQYLTPLLAPVLLAMLFVTIFGPMMKRMNRKLHFPRPLSAIVLLILATLLLAVLLWVLSSWVLGSLPVIGGECDRVELIAGADFCYSLADGESLTLSLGPRGFVYAPVCAGEEAGEAYVLLGEKVVGKIPLYYGAPVERQTEEKKSLWERIGGLLP